MILSGLGLRRSIMCRSGARITSLPSITISKHFSPPSAEKGTVLQESDVDPALLLESHRHDGYLEHPSHREIADKKNRSVAWKALEAVEHGCGQEAPPGEQLLHPRELERARAMFHGFPAPRRVRLRAEAVSRSGPA